MSHDQATKMSRSGVRARRGEGGSGGYLGPVGGCERWVRTVGANGECERWCGRGLGGEPGVRVEGLLSIGNENVPRSSSENVPLRSGSGRGEGGEDRGEISPRSGGANGGAGGASATRRESGGGPPGRAGRVASEGAPEGRLREPPAVSPRRREGVGAPGRVALFQSAPVRSPPFDLPGSVAPVRSPRFDLPGSVTPARESRVTRAASAERGFRPGSPAPAGCVVCRPSDP